VQIYSRRLVQVGVLIFVTIALALSAQAASFSNASLKGSYSFLVNKWTADVNTNQLAVVGVMTFDGAGNVTGGSYTEITGGVVQTGTLGGTYTVNSNGTGTINLTSVVPPPQLAITLNSTAAKLAHSVQLLQTNDNANEVISGTAVLQSTTAATCSVASLKGNLSWQANKWTADVNDAQEGAVGTFIFDGKGNVKGVWTTMYGGVLQTGTLAGPYTVNSDGSGSMTLTSSSGYVSQDAFVLNNKPPLGTAKGLQFLQTNTNGNIVISGIALKQ
jgi:hypothetical protein